MDSNLKAALLIGALVFLAVLSVVCVVTVSASDGVIIIGRPYSALPPNFNKV